MKTQSTPAAADEQRREVNRWRRIRSLCAWVMVAAAVVFVLNLAATVGRSGLAALKQAAAKAPSRLTPLQRAEETIPSALKEIYSALDEGQPSRAGHLISSAIVRDAQRVDRICKPFTYRAHYVEAIIEQQNNGLYPVTVAEGAKTAELSKSLFEVRVRTLFKPLEEQATVFIFCPLGNRFVVMDTAHDGSNDRFRRWFLDAEQSATEAAREFVYAAKAKLEDRLRNVVAPGLPTAQFITDPCWEEVFAGDVRIASIREMPYKGLKIAVTVELSRTSRNSYGSEATASCNGTFLAEFLNRWRIVGIGSFQNSKGSGRYFRSESCKGTDVLYPGKEPKTAAEDASLESRTLARFRLNESLNSKH